MIQHLIDDDTCPDLMANLRRINGEISRNQGTKQAIIVAGHSLVSIDSDDEIRE